MNHGDIAEECGLDLAGLDANATDFYLLVDTAEEIDFPIRAPAREVPRAIHQGAGLTERTRDKAFLVETGPVQVATSQATARYEEFARGTGRNELKRSESRM